MAKTTPDNIHQQRKRRNLLTALAVVVIFGSFALASILFNIFAR